MTPWQAVWIRPALHDLRGLDRKVASRVRQAVAHFAETGRGDVRKLEGEAGKWRLRVGDWRVTFRREPSARTIVVLNVEPRGGAYRR